VSALVSSVEPETVRWSMPRTFGLVRRGALGGTRTPNLLIRSQMLYPLSYERRLNPG
jgi:hypothetical protein